MGNFYEAGEDKGLNSRKFLTGSRDRKNSQSLKIKFNEDVCLFNNSRWGVTISGSDPGTGVVEMIPNGGCVTTAEYGAKESVGAAS